MTRSCAVLRFAAGPFFVLTLLLSLSPAHAQYYDYLPVGARSTAMGGASIAAGSPGEAAALNPARLIHADQIRATLGLRHRSEGAYGPSPSETELYDVTASDLGTHLASLLLPVDLQALHVTFALAHYAPVEPLPLTSDWSGRPMAITPALAIELHDRVAVGLAAHFWEGEIVEEQVVSPDGGEAGHFHGGELSGFSSTLGVSWRAWQVYQQHKLDLGLMLRSQATLDFEESAPIMSLGRPLTGMSKIELPASAGIGVSYTYANETTIALDLERGVSRRPKLGDLGHRYQNLFTNHLRVGVEHRFSPASGMVFPLRAGGRWFSTPLPDENNDPTAGHALSVGGGIEGERFAVDIAYALQTLPQSGEFGDEIRSMQFEHGTVVLQVSARF